MAGADNMENTNNDDESIVIDSTEEDDWFGCDFCASDEELHCCGDVSLCTKCRDRLEDEIASVESLMEEE